MHFVCDIIVRTNDKTPSTTAAKKQYLDESNFHEHSKVEPKDKCAVCKSKSDVDPDVLPDVAGWSKVPIKKYSRKKQQTFLFEVE